MCLVILSSSLVANTHSSWLELVEPDDQPRCLPSCGACVFRISGRLWFDVSFMISPGDPNTSLKTRRLAFGVRASLSAVQAPDQEGARMGARPDHGGRAARGWSLEREALLQLPPVPKVKSFRIIISSSHTRRRTTLHGSHA